MIYREWTPSTAADPCERSVALGVFDGLHLGHRAVISTACDLPLSRRYRATVLALTGVPKAGDYLLTDEEERRVAETLGVDEWLSVPFSAIHDLSPAAFVRGILQERLQARVVSCGYNFRFGVGGVGTADTLRELCSPLGIEVRVVSAVTRDGGEVSSTAIRCALQEGKPELAAALLGRPYTLALPVRHGNQLGSQWGFPTLNQPIPLGHICPRFGVYASLVTVDGVQYRAITNIGVHPTVGDTALPQAETYIDGFSGDLYDTDVSVQLIRFLRDEQRFDSVEALTARIAADAESARALLRGDTDERAILFDFDDTLQDRTAAFLSVARELVDTYFPTLPAPAREARARILLERNNNGRGYVNYPVYFAELCELWEWGVPPEQLLADYYRRMPYHSALLPDAVPVLRQLRRRGYRVGIITNGFSQIQNGKLDATALRPLLDAVAVSGDEGVHKPDPAVFCRVAERLCVAPERCVYVGDHPINDMQGATAAGMQPIYMDLHGYYDVPDIPRITALSELLDRYE